MTGAERIRHDTTVVYRFIQRTISFAAPSRGSRVYSDATKAFRDYVYTFGDKTLDFLKAFPASLPHDESLFDVYRHKLSVLRSGWGALHQFIKPTSDADTLHFPLQWLEALTERLHKLNGLEEAQFAVFHTSEVNYLILNANSVQQVVENLRAIVPGTEEFPSSLALVGIPYSQYDTLFPNSLIAHEIGHFVFQHPAAQGSRASVTEVLLQQMLNEIESLLASKETLLHEDLSWFNDKLTTWTEELFCDLFAVALAGPAYSFAYIDLFDLPTLLRNAAIPREPLTFSNSHPSDVFRLQHQARLLKRLNWWPHIEPFESDCARTLRWVADCQSTSRPCDYRSQTVAEACLRSFAAIAPSVEDWVVTLFSDMQNGAAEFGELDSTIQQYLRAGVVPSTLVVEHDAQTSLRHPEPITVLNSAYKLYLESLDKLIDGIENSDPSSVSERANWANRLELWALKAVEDYRLLAKKV